jgi:hypothetical protein
MSITYTKHNHCMLYQCRPPHFGCRYSHHVIGVHTETARDFHELLLSRSLQKNSEISSKTPPQKVFLERAA